MPKRQIQQRHKIDKDGNSTVTSCIDCSTGKYNDQTGQRNCKDCSKGKYSNDTGLSNCIDCSAGKYNDFKLAKLIKIIIVLPGLAFFLVLRKVKSLEKVLNSIYISRRIFEFYYFRSLNAILLADLKYPSTVVCCGREFASPPIGLDEMQIKLYSLTSMRYISREKEIYDRIKKEEKTKLEYLRKKDKVIMATRVKKLMIMATRAKKLMIGQLTQKLKRKKLRKFRRCSRVK